jgi:type IV secretion system protein VirB4
VRRSVVPYLPHLGHESEYVIGLEDGSLLTMAKVRGVPHELAADRERNVAAELLNRIWCNIYDDNITICAHLVRRKVEHQLPEPSFRSDFPRRLYDAYRHHALRNLYTNDWYLTLIVSPRTIPFGSERFKRELGRAFHSFRKSTPLNVASLAAIEDIWAQIANNLAGYNLRRLGYRKHGHYGYRFSEPGEAMRRFLGLDGPVPVTTGRLARVIVSDADQPVFERRIYRILSPGCDDDSDDAEGVRWGTIFGLNDYMEETHPDLFDALLSLPMELVFSQSYGFQLQPSVISQLIVTRQRMRASGDSSIKERKLLKKAASRASSGKARWGVHQLSLAVYADSYRDLLANAGEARAALVNTAADIAPESAGNMAAYYGQLPGNFNWRTAPGNLETATFVDFANFGAYPRGSETARWGNPIPLRTTADTLYSYDPFVGDVGMTAAFGATGSGKSVLLCLLMAMMDQYMVDRPGIQVLFDKDRGNEIFIEAIGGNYLTVDFGKPSGLIPLRGFRDHTPYAHDCLTRLFKALIVSDGHGPMPPISEARLSRGVTAQLRLPVELRTMAGLREYLGGWDDPLGAGRRFERWCRGGSAGWLFDGDDDRVDFDAPAVAFNLGPILETPEFVEPATQYLRDRIVPILDGRRVAAFFDEYGKYGLSPSFERSINDFWRTWRKLNGIAFLATQWPEDLLGSTFGRAILAQCQTIIFCPGGEPQDLLRGRRARLHRRRVQCGGSPYGPGVARGPSQAERCYGRVCDLQSRSQRPPLLVPGRAVRQGQHRPA